MPDFDQQEIPCLCLAISDGVVSDGHGGVPPCPVHDEQEPEYFRMRRNCTCSWDEDEANINGLDDQCPEHGRQPLSDPEAAQVVEEHEADLRALEERYEAIRGDLSGRMHQAADLPPLLSRGEDRRPAIYCTVCERRHPLGEHTGKYLGPDQHQESTSMAEDAQTQAFETTYLQGYQEGWKEALESLIEHAGEAIAERREIVPKWWENRKASAERIDALRKALTEGTVHQTTEEWRSLYENQPPPPERCEDLDPWGGDDPKQCAKAKHGKHEPHSWQQRCPQMLPLLGGNREPLRCLEVAGHEDDHRFREDTP